MIKKVCPALAVSLLLTLTGCVSETIEPEYIPNVSAVQNSQGLVTISWPSRVGYNYRLVARQKSNVTFDKRVYPGTGEEIVVQFKRDPRKPLPDYTVQPEKTGP